MANALFGPGREGFLDGTIDYDTAVIKVSPIRAYTFSSAHKFVSDVTTAGGVLHGTAATLGSKTVTNGTAGAAHVTFTAVAADATRPFPPVFPAGAVTGGADVAASAQRVICYIDTGTNIPFVPNGGDVVVAWDNGANKIFTL